MDIDQPVQFPSAGDPNNPTFQWPYGSLAVDSEGSLYGNFGSVYGFHIYRLTPPTEGQSGWNYTQLYGFPAGIGSALGVTIVDGALYGISYQDGVGSSVFRLAPPGPGQRGWQFTTIRDFSSDPPAYSNPNSTLLARQIDGHLTLFGTTSGNGFSSGSVFQLTAPTPPAKAWAYSTIFAFPYYPDTKPSTKGSPFGASPLGALIADRSLNLFGVTQIGGANNLGVAYELSPPAPGTTTWTPHVLHDFGGAIPSYRPTGPLSYYGGVLYGTATCDYRQIAGCTGSLYKLTIRGDRKFPWVYQTVHAFSELEGNTLNGGLVLRADGPQAISLYGTAEDGGADYNGSVFQVDVPLQQPCDDAGNEPRH